MLRATIIAGLLLALPASVSAAPLQILAIGDSLTEEYAFEIPFSAPASEPGDANIRNWPELLRIFRPDEATLGVPYKETVGGYSDLRNGGHPRNFSVPGFTTADWIELLNTSTFPTDFSSPGYAERLAYYRTREALVDELPVADVVVILLGGNDLKQAYFRIFAGTEEPGFYEGLVENMRQIHQFVFSRVPALPIVVCTFPDVGATPQIANSYTDPTMSAQARTKIAQLNQDIIEMVAEENAKPGHDVPTQVARIDLITDRAHDQDPFHINGTVFTLEGHPENPPDRLFARDDFHPATAAQALIANEIMGAINSGTAASLTPFGDREILDNLLGLDPDQPYADWAAGFTLADDDMNADPDRDGLPNLVEMGLGTTPDDPSAAPAGSWAPDSGISWSPDPVAARYLRLFAEESGDLQIWSPVPESRITESGGSFTAVPPAGAPSHFARLRAEPR